jgi:hypothetical protein
MNVSIADARYQAEPRFPLTQEMRPDLRAARRDDFDKAGQRISTPTSDMRSSMLDMAEKGWAAALNRGPAP